MSDPNNATSSRGGKSGSTPTKTPPGNRSTGRSTKRAPVTPHDYNEKHYDNPAIKFCLVFPGQPELTSVFLVHKLTANKFMCGRDHESTHAAAKQTIYDILVRDLSSIIPFDKSVKQAFSALVEEFYNPKSVKEKLCTGRRDM